MFGHSPDNIFVFSSFTHCHVFHVPSPIGVCSLMLRKYSRVFSRKYAIDESEGLFLLDFNIASTFFFCSSEVRLESCKASTNGLYMVQFWPLELVILATIPQPRVLI